MSGELMIKNKNFNLILPYTYYIKHKETGLKYYGVRWHNIYLEKTPEEDFLNIYFTSIKSKKYKWFKDLLIKDKSLFEFRLHYTFCNKEDAIEFERRLTKKIYRKEGWVNLSAGRAISWNHFSDEEKKIIFAKSALKRKGGKKNFSKEWIEELRLRSAIYLNPPGKIHPLLGTHMSIESKSKLSNSISAWYKNNPETNKGARNGMYGKGANYKAISPEGLEYVITAGFAVFCRERGIDPSSAIRCAQGKQKTARKWVFSLVPDQE